ncbi:MAG TPA: helix-turn-helix domain-containing protein, partial [Roseiflexaceae bacterium]|nr:helix-turn-helix domain-containing protein [Roseiflexaceae bacterium]
MPRTTPSSPDVFATFGDLLRYLRRRARLSQRELAIEVGYSEAYISRLEANQRPPDISTLLALFVPALDLEDQPELAARLIELGTAARGERPPRSVTVTHTSQQTSSAVLGEVEAIPLPPSCEVLRLESLARLREQLSAERGVAICALAGMGKTTLAAALAREQAIARPVFWLTLTAGITTAVDTLVRQLALFLLAHGQEQIVALLQRANSGTPAPLDQQIELIGRCLARLAEQHGGSRAGRYTGLPLLCLDNVHLVQDDPAVMQLLRHLAAATPASLLLTSRAAVPLAGVVSVKLRGMGSDEGAELIERLGGALEPALVERLLEKTDGSPMLLRLALGQLREQQITPASLIAHLEQVSEVSAYLLETTLQNRFPAAQYLLTLLAVFRRPVDLYDDSLLDLIHLSNGGAHDLAAGIAELQRHYLIEQPARAALHRLVRDQVYASLGADLQRKRELHLIAAQWLEQQAGDVVEAAYHYGRANQPARGADLLDEQLNQVIDRGQALSAADVASELLAQARRRRGESAELVRRLLAIRGALLVDTLRAEEAEA